jgi:hypothetical protein
MGCNRFKRLGVPMDEINPEVAKQEVNSKSPLIPPLLLPLAPKLMLVFWMLLGAVAGITLAQGVWRMVGLSGGTFSVAVPVGAVAGAVGGGLVGQITRPHLLVLIMAMLAGWSVCALGGRLAWGETGQIAGGFTGALIGGLTWAVWLLGRRGDEIKSQASVPGPTQQGRRNGPNYHG